MALTKKLPATKAPSPSETGANNAKSGATVSGVFIQTSTYATPIGLVYGSARISPNLVQLVDLVASKAGNQKKISMKGLGSLAGYNYTAAIVLALCQGPIAGVSVVWQDRQAPVLFNPTFTGAGWSLFLGTSGQSPWAYMTAHHPTEAIPYDQIAYVAAAGVNLPSDNLSSYSFLVQGLLPFGGSFRNSDTGHVVGSAGSLVNFNTSLTEADDYFDGGTVIFNSGANLNLAFPVQRSLHASGQVQCLLPMPNAPVNGDTFTIIPSGDASPADIIPDLLQNKVYGLGIDAGRFASLTAFQQYCAAAGLFCSPAYDEQQTAAEQIDDLLTIANTALIWSDGRFKFIPYGDTTISGNGQTFTPNTTPLYSLTDDDFLGKTGEDPIKIQRKRPADAFNRVTIAYEDNSAASGYASSVAEVQDLASVEAYGIRDMTPQHLAPIRSSIVAQQVAQLLLQRQVAVRNTYTFALGWKTGSLVEPMDLLELNDQGLGLVETPVRVTEVVERSDEAGFDITAEDWPDGIATAPAYAIQGGGGYQPNTNVDPGSTVSPVIFEGPRPLASSPLEIWIGGSGGPNWGGCDVYVSTDNVTYTRVGSITARANFGVLTANIPTGPQVPTIDTTHTLSVDLTASGGALVTVSASDFNTLLSACYLGGANVEWLAYETATLTSAEHYDLTTLARGLYSSVPSAHSIGDPFIFCDQSLLHLPFPQGQNGQTLYFKFPAWNVYGVKYQTLAAAPVVTHVIGQPPNIVQPGLEVAIVQTASTNTAATFSVTVNDPTGVATTATVFVTWQGLTSLTDLTTGLPVAASYTATMGVARSFTAALNAPFAGGGFASFHAVDAMLADGYGTWYGSAVAQNASPSLLINIGNIMNPPDTTVKVSAMVVCPDNAVSIKWLASQSSQPSVASVVAGGTVVTAGAPVFILSDLGLALNLGDTAYLTVVYYDAAGFSWTSGQGQATRQNLQSLKRIDGSPSGLAITAGNTPHATYRIDGTTGALTVDNGALTGSGIQDPYSQPVIVPVGVTITGVVCTALSTSGTTGYVAFGLYRSRGGVLSLVSGSTVTPGGGWQTVTTSCSNLAQAGDTYYLYATFIGPAIASALAVQAIGLTYTMPNSAVTY